MIAEKLAPSVLEILGDELDVHHVDGTDRKALFEALAGAEALLVRSATRVDAEALGHAPGSRSSQGPVWGWTTSTCQRPLSVV